MGASVKPLQVFDDWDPDTKNLPVMAHGEVRMSNPRFPSEEQGAYDPMPRSPQPLSPGQITIKPQVAPGIDELPPDEDEAMRATDDEDDTGANP